MEVELLAHQGVIKSAVHTNIEMCIFTQSLFSVNSFSKLGTTHQQTRLNWFHYFSSEQPK